MNGYIIGEKASLSSSKLKKTELSFISWLISHLDRSSSEFSIGRSWRKHEFHADEIRYSPSLIAKSLGVSVSTARRVLLSLVDKGYLAIKKMARWTLIKLSFFSKFSVVQKEKCKKILSPVFANDDNEIPVVHHLTPPVDRLNTISGFSEKASLGMDGNEEKSNDEQSNDSNEVKKEIATPNKGQEMVPNALFDTEKIDGENKEDSRHRTFPIATVKRIPSIKNFKVDMLLHLHSRLVEIGDLLGQAPRSKVIGRKVLSDWIRIWKRKSFEFEGQKEIFGTKKSIDELIERIKGSPQIHRVDWLTFGWIIRWPKSRMGIEDFIEESNAQKILGGYYDEQKRNEFLKTKVARKKKSGSSYTFKFDQGRLDDGQ